MLITIGIFLKKVIDNDISLKLAILYTSLEIIKQKEKIKVIEDYIGRKSEFPELIQATNDIEIQFIKAKIENLEGVQNIFYAINGLPVSMNALIKIDTERFEN